MVGWLVWVQFHFYDQIIIQPEVIMMNRGFSSHSLLNRSVFDIEKQGLVATQPKI